jgi:hypothetical protein
MLSDDSGLKSTKKAGSFLTLPLLFDNRIESQPMRAKIRPMVIAMKNARSQVMPWFNVIGAGRSFFSRK